ncbi:MAG: S8 family peptidase [Candidatus Omnitrophota bacterium]
MREKSFLIIIVVLNALLISDFCFAQEIQEYVPGEILIKFKSTTEQAVINAMVQSNGLCLIRDYDQIGISWLQLPSGMSVEEAVTQYSQREDVEFVQPNYIGIRKLFSNTPDDTYFSRLWGLHNTGQTVNSTTGTNDADIDAPEAWDLHTGSSSVVVAVVDTGIDLDHPDIAANIWINTDEIAANGIDDDGNGYIDDINGWDFVDGDNTPSDSNLVGHGTHVSGIIGAVGNNTAGVTGVCWQIKIMPLQAFDILGTATTSTIIASINYAIANGAKVINASYGGCFIDYAEQSAMESVNNASISFVAAAGNEASNNDEAPLYPASYDFSNIIAVAASDQNDALAHFSNYGANSVDVAAPGVNIYSTFPDNTYIFADGTSMATPFVSGLAALLFSYSSTYTAAELRQLIINSVDSLPGLSGKIVSGGRINAYNALTLSAPIGFSASPVAIGDASWIALNWKNPYSPGFSGVVIRYRTDGTFPVNSTDGRLLAEYSSTLGETVTYSHRSISGGITYYYSIFSKDTANNISRPVNASAVAIGVGGEGNSSSGGGCFITTACYGDYHAWPVRVLSCVRDNYLLKNCISRFFVRMYYQISPGLAQIIADNESLKKMTRFIIDLMFIGGNL